MRLPNRFSVGEWTVFPDSGRLTRGDEEEHLEPRALAVLLHLARHPGRLVTREELIAEVWTDRFVSEAVVTQAIFNIRSALGDEAGAPRYVRTVRGRGYELIARVTSRAGGRSEVGPWPVFVSRQREIGLLEAMFEESLSGGGRTAFITGEAGTGKTTLASELLRRAVAGEPGLLAAVGSCTAPAVGHPYEPFRRLLEALLGARARDRRPTEVGTLDAGDPALVLRSLLDHGGALLGSLVSPTLLLADLRERPEVPPALLDRLAEQAKSLGPAPSRALPPGAVAESFSDLLGDLAGRRPLLLVLEDLHWAEASTLDLLHLVASRLATAPAMIVGTFRPENLRARDGDPPALTRVVHELERAQGSSRVDLDRAAGRDFVDAYLDSRPNRLDGEFRQALFRLTGGHALFTCELLHALVDRGSLVRDDDGRWGAPAEIDWTSLPARTESVIAERIGRLPDRQRQVLELAAVEGEEFTAEAVALALEVPPQRVVAVLSNELAQRRRLVEAHEVRLCGGRRLSVYRFRHLLFQRYLYEHLDATLRAYLHQEVAGALEALHGEEIGAIAERLAWHYRRASMPVEAIEYHHRASEGALRLNAVPSALEQARAGLDLLDRIVGHPRRDTLELRLQLDLAAALHTLEGYNSRAAQPHVDRARELCRVTGESRFLFEALYRLAGFHGTRGQLELAIELARDGLELAERLGEPSLRMMALLMLGWIETLRGRLETALEAFSLTLELDERVDDPALKHVFGYGPALPPLCWGAWALRILGRDEEAIEWSGRAIERGRALDHPSSLAYGLYVGGVGFHRLAGDEAEIRRLVPELGELCRRERLLFYLDIADFYEAWIRARDGEREAGIAAMDEALGELAKAGLEAHVAALASLLAETEMEAGRHRAARQRLDEWLARVERNGELLLLPELQRLRARLDGDEAAARERLDSARRLARDHGHRLWEERADADLRDLEEASARRDASG